MKRISWNEKVYTTKLSVKNEGDLSLVDNLKRISKIMSSGVKYIDFFLVISARIIKK